jgi:hypothetical protein
MENLLSLLQAPGAEAYVRRFGDPVPKVTVAREEFFRAPSPCILAAEAASGTGPAVLNTHDAQR